ncbi:hypothetical protein D9M71_589360 [compost metagenome]
MSVRPAATWKSKRIPRSTFSLARLEQLLPAAAKPPMQGWPAAPVRRSGNMNSRTVTLLGVVCTHCPSSRRVRMASPLARLRAKGWLSRPMVTGLRFAPLLLPAAPR